MTVTAKAIHHTLPGTQIGAAGYLGARIQPNSPTDHPDDVVWQVFSGFSAQEQQSVIAEGGAILDPSGKVLWLNLGHGKGALMEMPSWKLLEFLGRSDGEFLSPGARYWGRRQDSLMGLLVGRAASKNPLVNLGIDSQVSSTVSQFGDDGRMLAWGNADGTVFVADINEVQRRLAEFGLGWE